ncbi:hypothetical protein L1887_35657 [Cichorium endivia]|nr:hypothetical protein L1887_35657 [Cichorium endivia]
MLSFRQPCHRKTELYVYGSCSEQFWWVSSENLWIIKGNLTGISIEKVTQTQKYGKAFKQFEPLLSLILVPLSSLKFRITSSRLEWKSRIGVSFKIFAGGEKNGNSILGRRK